jgi:predicted aldo/keto reductase-like oxidoreductase
MEQSRRHFVATAAAITLPSWLEAAPDAATNMPMRNFGQTGKKITTLAFGCGSRFLMYKDEAEWTGALNKAYDHGIRYFDTAFDYGRGESETRIGKVLADRRKEIWLTTKLPARKGDEAMRILEGSLKRCQTDHFDLVHIHSLTTEQDLAAIEAKDGVLNALYKMREQKVVHNVGVSCHTDPKVLKTALERNDFNCTQFALNAARIGMAAVDGDSFEALALPVALKKKMGIVAMKIFGQDKLKGKATSQQLIRYSLSLPVGAVVIGMPELSMLEQNVATVKAFQPMTRDEMKGLNEQLSGQKAAMDRYFFDHLDA